MLVCRGDVEEMNYSIVEFFLSLSFSSSRSSSSSFLEEVLSRENDEEIYIRGGTRARV